MRDEDFLAESLESSRQTGPVFGSDQSDICGSNIDTSTILNALDHQNSLLSPPNVRKQHKASDSGQFSRGLGQGGVDGCCHPE